MMTASISDQDLLTQFIRDRSDDAFHRLITRYRPLVVRTCLRRLGNAEAAEDATQETFLALARRADDLIGHPTLAGWLTETARRISLNHGRQRQREQDDRRRLAELWAQIALWKYPVEGSVRETTRARLYTALSTLNPDEQTAILLRFDSEMSFAEIGSALGVSHDAARMRVQRALERMKRHLRGGTVSRRTRRKDGDCMTFSEAAERLRMQVIQDGKDDLIPFLSDERLRDGIQVGRTAYPGTGSQQGEAYLTRTIDPLIDAILARGEWPASAEFAPFYSLKDERGTVHPGFGLTIEFQPPDTDYPGFSLSVLDLWYGAWA